MKRYYKYRKKKLTLAELVFPLLILLYLNRRTIDDRFNNMVITLVFICGVVTIVSLIYKSTKSSVNRNKYIVKRYCEVDKMSGEEFELFLKAHFEKKGYLVKTTPKSNDYGVDLVCKKDGKKMALQAKRYKGKVGIGAVQQIIGGMSYYDCDTGIVATNSYFTANAKELAKKSGVMLWDRNKLAEVFNITN